MSELSAFKDRVTAEIIGSDFSGDKEVTAFLSALVKHAGAINIVKKRVNLVITLSTYDECLFVVGLLKRFYPAEFEISAEEIKSGSKKGSRTYSVMVPTGYSRQVLVDTLLIPEDSEAFSGFEDEVPQPFFKDVSLAKAYLKGLFLAVGGIYVPSLNEEEKKDGYHFEYRLDEQVSAESVKELLSLLGASAKISERGALFLVYIKDRDEILNLLALLGLCDCALTLKGIIDERDTANSLNRAVICETANLDKTFVAASKHLLAIGLIEDAEGLDSLPPTLKETAQARMEYPQSSLSELADILKVTKSCLNHRLRKLLEIAGMD